MGTTPKGGVHVTHSRPFPSRPSAYTSPPNPRGGCIIGVATCARFVGAAVLRRGVQLRVTRVDARADDAAERVRLSAWVENIVVRAGAGLVALAGRGPHDDLVRGAVARHGLSTFDLERPEIAAALGVASSLRAIATAAVARAGSVVDGASRLALRGPRSEAERYWAMSLLALAAALCGRTLVAPHQTVISTTDQPTP